MSLNINLVKKEYLTDMNITHNLAPMWKLAGVYDALYNSDGEKAEDMLPILIDGLTHMIANPTAYKELNSPNGWGVYENAVPWLSEVVKKFKDNPKAIIEVSR